MPIMYPLRLETNRFADAAEVYDAVFLGKHRLDGSPLEYAANFSTALRTDFIHTPENRVIVSRDIADALAQVGPDAKRTDVILIDSDIETRKPRHGARVCHDFVAIQIPNLTDSLDYTRVTATPKTVHTTKPTPDPVLACDDDMPPLFYYGRRKLHASAAARQVFENAREVSVLAGYGRRRDEGRTQEMQKVLDTNAPSDGLSLSDISRVDAHGFDMLFYAAEVGNEAWADALIAAGANVNRRNARGMTPLMVAAYHGHEHVFDRLTSVGAQLEAQDHAGWTSAQWSAYCGHDDLAVRLRKIVGASDVPDVFSIAVRRPSRTLLARLVETGEYEGALTSALGDAHESYQAVIGRKEDYTDIAADLIRYGASVQSSLIPSSEFLRMATSSPHLELLSWLLEHGVPADSARHHGETALARLAGWPPELSAKAHPAMVLLLQHGADPKISDKYGNSPIHNAQRVVERAKQDPYASAVEMDAAERNLTLLLDHSIEYL